MNCCPLSERLIRRDLNVGWQFCSQVLVLAAVAVEEGSCFLLWATYPPSQMLLWMLLRCQCTSMPLFPFSTRVCCSCMSAVPGPAVERQRLDLVEVWRWLGLRHVQVLHAADK